MLSLAFFRTKGNNVNPKLKIQCFTVEIARLRRVMNSGCLVVSYGTVLAVAVFVSNLYLWLDRVTIYEDSQYKAWSPGDA